MDEVADLIADLPGDEREAILDGLREHVEEGLERAEHIDAILLKLGDPALIARDALNNRQGAVAIPVRKRWLLGSEALILTVSAIVLGSVGFLSVNKWIGLLWLGGLILLWWPDSRWNTLGKLYATLGIPVVYAVAVLTRVGRWVTASDCSVDGSCKLIAPWFMLVLGWILIALLLAAATWSVSTLFSDRYRR